MVRLELDIAAVGPDFFEDGLKGFPFVAAPEVVHEDEAAIEHVVAEDAPLFVADVHVSGFGYIEEGVMAELVGVDVENDGIGADLDGGELMEAVGEIEVGLGVIGCPAQATAEGVAETGEGEDIVREVGVEIPHRGIVTVMTPAFELAWVLRKLDLPAPVDAATCGRGELGVRTAEGEQYEAWEEGFPEPAFHGGGFYPKRGHGGERIV